VRLRVPGLHRNPELKQRLERRLPGRGGIRAATASSLSGNLLLYYEPQLSVSVVLAAVGQTLGENENEGGAPPAFAAPARDVPSSAGSLTTARRAEPLKALRPADTTTPWHMLSVDDVCARLDVVPSTGLPATQAAARLAAGGPNVITRAPPRSGLQMVAEQLKGLPVALLLGSAGLSVATGAVVDAFVILGVVGLNAGIGYATESQTERTISALGDFVARTATVLRDGTAQTVPTEEIVPGDLLLLSPGTLVAADVRVVTAQNLFVDESALTGEALPVSKLTTSLPRTETPLAERANMVFKGTAIIGGGGVGVVVGTGAATEMGRIRGLAETARPPQTPMQGQLNRMGRQLAWLSLGACGLAFGLGVLRGTPWLPMLKTSISLAVAALPEGLPTVATTTLALGVRNMRRRNILIRRLDAVETLGAVGVMCLDKTGTLTLNRMAVVSVVIGDGEHDATALAADAARKRLSIEAAALLEVCILCSEADLAAVGTEPKFSGSPTEIALLELALACDFDVAELRRRFPMMRRDYRSEARPYMVSRHHAPDGRRRVAVKGNPVDVLQLCASYAVGGTTGPLDAGTRAMILAANQRLAARGLRVLGFAAAGFGEGGGDEDMVWLGMTGLSDPVRPGMKELMRTFHGAGVRSIMITGDQSATAFAIARELDLSDSEPVEILEGVHLDRLEPEVLSGLAERTHVFARVSPANKLQIVQALQRAGKVVAMTGDGVNDGPALRAADIGVAMGQGGTEVARELSDVVLADDRLETMAAALGEGRTIYRNVRKSIHYLLATNSSETMLILAGAGMGLAQLLTPLQLLWLNLMSDVFPALALAVEPPEPDVMRLPPRDPSEQIVARGDLQRLALDGTVLGASSLGTYFYGRARYGAGPAASALAFTQLTTAQILHAFACRTDARSALRGPLPPNRHLTGTVWGLLAVQGLAAVFPPTRQLLGLGGVGAFDLAIAGAGGVVPLLISNAIRRARRRPGSAPMNPRRDGADPS
jgi:Ca2+-transporting ATPase